jgi:hypothetical protein
MYGQTFWNPVRNPDKSDFFGIFGLWIDFNDLHFLDSFNVPPPPLDSTELIGLK